MNSIDNLFPNQEVLKSLTPNVANANIESQTLENKPRLNNTDGSPVLSNRGQVATAVINRSMSSHLTLKEQSFNYSDTVKESIDYKAVAKSIMSFVSESLDAAKQRGASDNELDTLFVQAKKGILKGFSEAIKELKELNIFDESIKDDLSKAKSTIDGGLEKLHQQLLPEEKINQPTLNERIVGSISNLAVTPIDEQQQYLSRSQSANLIVETADGDKIEISFERMQQKASTFKGQSSQSEMNFSLSVNGELDDDELKAIESLMKDINSLQKDFFSGDVSKVFEKALNLGFDSEELAGFSLNLQQTQTSIVSQRYAEVENLSEQPNKIVNRELLSLANLFQQIERLQADTDKVFGKKDVFGELLGLVYGKGHNAEDSQETKNFKTLLESTAIKGDIK